VFAVSDGASESFASRRWARILVSAYARRPEPSEPWISDAIGCYNRCFDFPSMSWSSQAAFERGSFATLLGARIEDKEGTLSLLAINDSLAVLAEGDRVRETFPYTDAQQFGANPLLLATVFERNAEIIPGELSVQWSFRELEAPRLMCMTDALGAWLLTDKDERLAFLSRIRTRAEFETFVLHARAQGEMRTDDTSLLVIH
jgi:hypothetical protein